MSQLNLNQADATATRRRLRKRRCRSSPRLLPGAIEHRVQEKLKKFRSFLGADVGDPRCFVPFVLEASGRLGTAAAGAFLEHQQRTLCRFLILRFRALVSVITVKHNARMAFRWVRYLRHPI